MMKKFTLLVITIFLSTFFVQAQYSLSWDGEPIGDTVIVNGEPSDTELIFHAVFTNNSDDSDSILVKREIVSVLDGVHDQLCWGLCYAPNTDPVFISPSGMRIEAGQSTEDFTFSGHYLSQEYDMPIGVVGTTIFSYTFFNADNEDENIVVIVKFVTSADQSDYALSWDGEPLGDTVTVKGDPAETELIFHAIFTNNSSDSDSVLVKRELLSVLDGVHDQLCWGLCYAPNTDPVFISPSGIRIEAGQSTEDFVFSGHYLSQEYDMPIGVIGTSVFKYTFFNANDEDENIVVVVEYDTSPDGIAEHLMANGFVSEIYPNPATTFANIDYELTPQVKKASLRVINLLGAVVKDVELNKNASNHRLDVSNLTRGVYFYSVIINNEVYKTKKLIVN